MNVIILTPVYNDWQSLTMVLARLSLLLEDRPERFEVLIVDDSSTETAGALSVPAGLTEHAPARIVRLRMNLGHQRAIAVGLTWIHNNGDADCVVVMDSDGEDRPEDVTRLLDEFLRSGRSKGVFARRARRSEGLVFTIFYRLYQLLHRLLTGLPVRIGNFSVIPRDFVSKLVVSGYLWNHYAATAVRLKLPRTELPASRGTRLYGTSRMNFVSLVKHGLSAISVHSELVGVRLLVACGIGSVGAICALAVCIWIRYFTDLAIAGWATYVSGFSIVVLIQMLSLTFSFCVQALSNQNDALFVPVRDCALYVQGCSTIGDKKSQEGSVHEP